ncbi:MAG: DNA translocase FtsK 4TM domain-containing protein [Rhodospirillales bacterium]|nr:DNA translocase FtsK 4TM domain-containing protein [Rhodospirillales bacterium]
MATHPALSRPDAFLPSGTADFLRRRLIQLCGLAILAAAIGLGWALSSFAPDDPSLNTVTDGPVRNALGRPGAILADLLLQTLGIASALLVAVPALWGLRLLVLRPPGRALLRVLLLAFATLVATLPLALLPAPGGWEAGLGGFLGKLALTRLEEVALPWFLGLPTRIIDIVLGGPAALLALLALALSLDIPWRDWQAAAARLFAMGAMVGRAGAWTGRRMGGMAAGAGAFLAPRPGRMEPRLFDGPAPHPPSEPALSEPSQDPGLVEAAPSRKPRSPRQGALDLAARGKKSTAFRLPPLSLLAQPGREDRVQAANEDALAQNARLLESVLADFGVEGRIVKVRPGPVVTLYELEPAPGIKTSRVIGLADDIARSMSAISVRIAVVPGRNVIGIELPNAKRETVFLREMIASESFERSGAPLTLVLGKDIGGTPVLVDLARMPHLLIAGTTGSGKSVGVNAMILSLVFRLTPEQCRFIMIDPKMLELSVYDGIPHLLSPVVTDSRKAVVALKWAVREMENRYRAMSQLGVRNIAGYNQRLEEAKTKKEKLARTVQTGFDPETGKPIYEEQPLTLEPLPFIVVIVDEMADLMLVAGKEVEAAIQRLAQMARAAGIHLIMATQRPSVDVITGTIKANFPTRISFQVTSRIDSRTILNEQGAEQLLGQGDMLYMAAGGRIQRVHGPFASDREVEMVADHLRAQGEPVYLEEVTVDEEEEPALGDGADESDPLYQQALALVLRERKASTSFIQRHLQIGYNRAARIVDIMEERGVVGAANHVGKREVLIRSALE